jgi:5-methylcytosine-specific restriction endonuclease McrA
MRPVTKKKIDQYNKDDYDVLRDYLFRAIGSYCSYCEQPVSNDSAVEHKVPKSARKGNAAYATQWRNLLLCCQSCNSAKSDRPEFTTNYASTLNLWVWPDTTAAMGIGQPETEGDETNRLFKFVRDPRTQEALWRSGFLRDYWDGAVPAAAQASRTMTWIVPNDNYINTLGANKNSALARVKATLQGLNLNRYEPDNPTYNDRRVMNRDAAWGAAQSALVRLETVCRAAGRVDPKDPEVMLMVKVIRDSAIATGFWSVWFAIFRDAFDNPSAGSYWQGQQKGDLRLLLDRILYKYYDEECPPEVRYGNPTGRRLQRLVFPGTDDTRLNYRSLG